jgi:LuxR family transcriptional regulator, maltose regulon positive regulatory protein
MATTRCGRTCSPALLAWKFEVPRVADRLLPRDHLVTRIDQWLGRGCSTGDVFLLTAPAGYGKTTLLVQWARGRSVPVAWYRLDAGDDDPVAFIRGIVRAVRTRLPRTEWTVESFVSRLRGGMLSEAELRRATSMLIRDIVSNVRKPLALALTDLMELDPKGAAHRVLNALVTRPPDPLRLVIETRETPHLHVSPLLTQHRLDGLGADDLRLRDDELEALLRLTELPLDPAYVEALHTLCDGWITGVLLASGAAVPDFLSRAAEAGIDRERVFDYLAEEVIDELPTALREFATEAAVLGSMTAPLCRDLLDLSDAHQRLIALDKRTGFLTRIGRGPAKPMYRFQPLLRQALLERLEAEPDGAARRRMLHERAGALLEAQGDFEEAVKHFAQASDYERVIGVIEAKRGMLLRAGHGATLKRWVDQLPQSVRDGRPALQVLLAKMQRQAGSLDEAEASIEHACSIILPQAATQPGLAAEALLVRSMLHYARGRCEQARNDCVQGLQYTPDDADDLHVELRFALAACLEQIVGPDAGAECLNHVEERCLRMRDLWALSRLHYLRSRFYMVKGQYTEAETAATSALRYAQEAGDEVDAVVARLNLGAICVLTERFAAAREHFEMAHAQAETAGYMLGAAYALTNLADLELNSHCYEEAVRRYADAARAGRMAGDDVHLHTGTAAALGYTLTILGRAQQAQQWLEAELAEYGAGTTGRDWAALAISLGFAYHRGGDLRSADGALAQAAERAEASGAVIKVAPALYHLAAVQLAQGKRTSAESVLRRALESAAQVQGVSVLSFEAEQLPELRPLLQALDHPEAHALLAHLDKAEHARSDPAARTAQLPTEHAARADGSADGSSEQIRVYALGPARVLLGTEPVTGWRMPHARELLYYLLDRGEPVRKDEIIEDFWPDADCETGDNRFRQARFLLKKALGRECLAREGERWRLTAECWADVREFERLLDDGERLIGEGQLSLAVTALHQALTYWHGDYLDDFSAMWAVLRRESLRKRYITCLGLLADVKMRLDRHAEAAQHYYRILDADPADETAHRGLMRYFVRRGELAEANRQFARCCAAVKGMRQHLERETVVLFESIRSRREAQGIAGVREGANPRSLADAAVLPASMRYGQ